MKKQPFERWLLELMQKLSAERQSKQPLVTYDPPLYLRSRHAKCYFMVLSSDFAVEVDYDEMPGIYVTPIGDIIVDEMDLYKEITEEEYQIKGREVASRLINLINY